MTGDDENTDPSSDLSPTGYGGSSQAEAELYKLLLEERMKLARATGTAPYAICGDETLRRIALTRPSISAQLANIDGVNQHLMKAYGNHLLQSIKKQSNELHVSLDGNADAQPPSSKQNVKIPNERKLAPAKFEAWKMWQAGLTINKVANCPGRSAPIKDQTLIEYIPEVAKEGCEIDWIRFCEEIGMIHEVYNSILAAVAKVGKEKLKPIKNELTEVTYSQIKTCLVIQELGLPADVIPFNHQNNCKEKESGNEISGVSQRSNPSCEKEECTHKLESVKGNGGCSPVKFEEAVSDASVQNTSKDEPSDVSYDSNLSRKRQNVDVPEEEITGPLEATKSNVLSWLQNSDQGGASF